MYYALRVGFGGLVMIGYMVAPFHILSLLVVLILRLELLCVVDSHR
jgi:hypothetical protein